MDRRTLLAGLSAAAAWLSVSGCARLALNHRHPESDDSATSLSKQLAEMADPLFRDYSVGRSMEVLLAEMIQKRVISTRQGIIHNRLISLARHEPLVVYKGFYYTQTELELYALAYLHKWPETSFSPNRYIRS